ncbi:MAG: hypothetical protein KGN02_06070 [bacterium]|nr:hypothetical protein [bacterium]
MTKRPCVSESQLLPIDAAPGGAVLLYESANGAVHASLRLGALRAGRITFALRAINATREPLLVTFYAHVRDGTEVPLSPFSLWVDAGTHATLDLPVPWLAMLGTRAISARLQSRHVHQRVEAAMPRLLAPLWFLAGALLVLVGGYLWLALQPRVVALDAPSRVVAGSHFDLRFAARGPGARTWSLEGLDGSRVDGGALAGGASVVTIAAPRADRERTYVLRVSERNAFGSADATRPLVVETPAPSNDPPRITEFSLDANDVRDGGTIVARYRVDAERGDVLATDAQGTIWAEAPTNASGVTTLQLPRFGRRKELQVRLVVRRGAQLAASGLGVVATP